MGVNSLASNDAYNANQFALNKALYFSGILSKIDTTATAKLVLMGLVQHYNPTKKDFFPSEQFLTDKLGIGKRSVVRAIQELTNKGIIMTSRQSGRHNKYVFTPKFFSLLKMAPDKCQNGTSTSAKMAPKHITENINITNNNFSKNKNNDLTESDIKNGADQLTLDDIKINDNNNKQTDIKKEEITPPSEDATFKEKEAFVLANINDLEIRKYKKIPFKNKDGSNNYERLNFIKNKIGEFKGSQQSMKNIEQTKQLLNSKPDPASPLDFDKEQAIKYLNNLLPELKNSFFAKELRKKWGII